MSPMLGAPRRALLLVSFSLLALGALVGVAVAASGAATETPDQTFVASTTPSGEFADSGVGTGGVSISADGRYVAFVSGSANLNPEGTTTFEAYVKDLGDGGVDIASRADGVAGAPAGERVEAALLAAGGRYLAFATAAERLVAGVPGPPAVHVYRRDLQTGETEIVDRAGGAGGEIVPSTAHLLAISPDGSLVAFADVAQELDDPAAPHPEGEETIYVRDLASGTTTAVAAEGAEEASFSADGRYLLFTSAAPMLPEAAGVYEVYRRDLATGDTVLVSRSNPTPAAPEGEPSSGEAYEAVFVGASDCEVAFMAKGPNNLAAGVAPPRGIYERDLCASPPTTALVSIDEAGAPFEEAVGPSTTTDGRIAFIAQEVSFEPGLLWVRSPAAGKTILLSRASGPEGEPADREVSARDAGRIAANGCRAAFTTNALNLVGEEEAALPGGPQTFVRQLAPCVPVPDPPTPEGGEGVPPGGEAPRPAAASGPAPVGPAIAAAIRVTRAGRHGLWLAFDGAGNAFVRVQRQAPGGGWKLIGSFAVAAAGPGVVQVELPAFEGGPLRLKARLRGDPDNPTLTRRLGAARRPG